MPIPTEPIGGIPRPPELIKGIQAFQDGTITQVELDALYDAAIRDTVVHFKATALSPSLMGGRSKQVLSPTQSMVQTTSHLMV